MMFRIAKTERCDRKCVELQRLVTHGRGSDRDPGTQEWVSYCILARPEQALQIVEHFEPDLLQVAAADLGGLSVLQPDPSLEVRVLPKDIRPW